MNLDRAKAIEELISVFSSEYGKRIWTVRKIVLAESLPEIASGVARISLRTIITLQGGFGNYFDYNVIIAGQHIALASTLHLVYLVSTREKLWRHHSSSPIGLNEVLLKFGRHDSTDIRDRIYGLIGMTRWNQNFDINYACPLLELYVKALRCVVEEGADGEPSVVVLPRSMQPEATSPSVQDYTSVDIKHIWRLTRALGMNGSRLSALLANAGEMSVIGLTTDSIPVILEIGGYWIPTPQNDGNIPISASRTQIPIDPDKGRENRLTTIHGVREYLLSRKVPDRSIIFVCTFMHQMKIGIRYDEPGECSMCYAYRGASLKTVNMPQELVGILTTRLSEDTSVWERLQTQGVGEIRFHFTPLELLRMLEFDQAMSVDMDVENYDRFQLSY